MGFWGELGDTEECSASAWDLFPQDTTPSSTQWRQQQAVWQSYPGNCSAQLLPSQCQLHRHGNPCHRGCGTKDGKLQQEVPFSHSPSAPDRWSTLGTQNREGFACLKARKLLEISAKIRQFGSLAISERLKMLLPWFYLLGQSCKEVNWDRRFLAPSKNTYKRICKATKR